MNGEPMARWFAGKSDIDVNSTDEDVIDMLNKAAAGAVGQAKEVLRTRVAQFGIAQPDIKLVGNTGRIIVDLPGVKDHKRVEKLLQGSAVLEIWDTYEVSDLQASLQTLNEKAKDQLNLENPLDSADFVGLSVEDSLALVNERNQPFYALIAEGPTNRASIGQFNIGDTSAVNKNIKDWL